jgi:hypothetical protein
LCYFIGLIVASEEKMTNCDNGFQVAFVKSISSYLAEIVEER